MRPIRFRLNMAVLSLSVSGVVMLLFGLFFLASIRRVGFDRLDREIRAVGESQLRGRHPESFWPGFGASLRYIAGDDPSRIFVRVLGLDGRALYASTNEPAGARVLGLDGPVRFSERPRDGAPFVRRLDRDGDGRVSPFEFDGPAEAFGLEDRNGDGFIDAEEAPRGPPIEDLAQALPPPEWHTLREGDESWRVGIMRNAYVTLVVGMSLAPIEAEVARFARMLAMAMPVALLLLAGVGWWLAGRALRPIAVITRTAERITATDLDHRVPAVAADAELARLVDVVNGMLERIERGYRQAARFSADAAHELQTPLTVLQGALDDAIQSAPEGSPEQRRYVGLLEDVQRLKTIVRNLLMLARADAGGLVVRRAPMDWSAAVERTAADVAEWHPDRPVACDVEPGLMVLADEALLDRVVHNLLDNALKYGQPGGRLWMRLRREGSGVRCSIVNEGDSIPVEHRARIFDRFYRVDTVHGRRADGSGLGLSLAREIVHVHGGQLLLDPDEPGRVSFSVVLPA